MSTGFAELRDAGLNDAAGLTGYRGSSGDTDLRRSWSSPRYLGGGPDEARNMVVGFARDRVHEHGL